MKVCLVLRQPLNGPRGITIVEMMISVAVVAIVAMMVSQIIKTNEKLNNVASVKFELNREMQTASFFLIKHLRQARFNTIAISRAAGEPYASEIAYRITGEPDTVYGFFQQGDTLVFSTEADSVTRTRVIARDVERAVFSMSMYAEEAYSYVLVSLTFDKKNILGDREKLATFSEKIKIKNQ